MRRCERRCEEEQMWEKMWRWADVREDVKMSRCEDEQMWEMMWRWADVKMSRCERRSEDERMWRWADVREDVKMSRCERRSEDEQMWEKIWRWADVKMRRCEDEQMWRWADVKMRRCEDEKMWRWEGVTEGVKMRRREDERRCEDEKMRYRPPLLEEPCAQTLSGKKCRNPKRRFCFWRSPEVLTQDIQTYSKMTLPKKSVCEGFGTMAHHPYASLTKRWSQYPEQYKTPFLHGLCKSMNSKHSGKKKSVMVSEHYAVMLGNYALMLGNYAVMFGSYDVNIWWFFP